VQQPRVDGFEYLYLECALQSIDIKQRAACYAVRIGHRPAFATAPDGSMHALPVLSLQAEREQLLETLHAAEREMSVRFETATTDALRAVMTMGTGILHWSGHGEEGSIAFEDGSGATHSLSPQSLADTCLAVRTEYVPTGLRVRVPLAADGEAWHATQRGVASMTTRRGILHVHSMRRGVWHATQRGNLPMY